MSKLKTFFSRIMSIEPIRRQSIVSLIWQIAITFVGFLSTMYFAHAVGADVLGAYYLFLAYYNIIGLMTDGGFGGAAIKRISEGEEPDAYFSAFFVLRSVFVTVVIIALFAFRSYFVDLNNSSVFVWLLVALFLSLVHGTISNGIAGCGKMGVSATAGFIGTVSQILVQVVAVFLGYSVAGLAGGFIIGTLVGAFIQLRFLDLRFIPFGWRHLKSLSSFSFWSFLVSSGGMVFMYADTVMIGHFLDNGAVGVYRVIFQFTSFAAFTTSALHAALWPRVSRWNQIGETRFIENSLSRAFTYSLILALPMFIGGALLGDKLLYYFYGAEFVNYTTLMILFLVQIVNIFQYFLTTYLSAMNQVKEVFKVTVVAVVANITLNLVLIPLVGISGAAVATLVTMSLNAILAGRVLARKITLRLERDSLLNILKASFVMGMVVAVFLLVVPLSNVWLTLIPVALGGTVYGMLILKFNQRISEDLKEIFMSLGLKIEKSW
jgi:O-antigen/teichoic acid export membrane protein